MLEGLDLESELVQLTYVLLNFVELFRPEISSRKARALL